MNFLVLGVNAIEAQISIYLYKHMEVIAMTIRTAIIKNIFANKYLTTTKQYRIFYIGFIDGRLKK